MGVVVVVGNTAGILKKPIAESLWFLCGRHSVNLESCLLSRSIVICHVQLPCSRKPQNRR